MMCHAPRDPVTTAAGALTAEVPIPGQPLPTPFRGLRLIVAGPDGPHRRDLPAAGLLGDVARRKSRTRGRNRSASTSSSASASSPCEEAIDYRSQLALKEPGVLSPYHKAALCALRELTGKDTAPTAEAWRKLLKLKTID